MVMTILTSFDPHSSREGISTTADDSVQPLHPVDVPPLKPHQNGQCKMDNNHHHHHPTDPATVPLMDEKQVGAAVISRDYRVCNDAEESDDDVDTHCGVGSLKPSVMQHLANKKVFLLVFCLASVLQGMFYTYFVSVLTTIEKLFQIQSKTTGIIMSATEIGQIGGALLLSYYGGQGHRPKWIGFGLVLFAFASFLCSLPHFLYGGELSQSLNMDAKKSSNMSNLCTTLLPDEHYLNMSNALCQEHDIGNSSHITNIVLGVFFVSLLFIGIGSTAVYILGIPYIDDNVANRESPLYFAITIGVKILGPVLGFLLGSVCTMIYVYPFEESRMTNEDPRWIGAWWLGPFVISALLVFVSCAMFSFPRKLPRRLVTRTNGHMPVPNPITSSNSSSTGDPNSTGSNSILVAKTKGAEGVKTEPSLRDFPVAMRRLLKNEILLLRTASTVLHILPIAGLYTFLPKFLESQFRFTATKAAIVTGTAGILVMGVGVFGSGMLMRRFKPNARFVAAWIAFTALACASGMVILSFIGCPLDDFAGLQEGPNGLELVSPCNTSCGCDREVFSPICTTEGQTYYSACHAGCRNDSSSTNPDPKGKVTYYDCDCLGSDVTATSGICPLECGNFIWYIVLFSLSMFIHSTSEVGAMLLTLRCVDPKDKAMALGLVSFAIGLFGNVPCPIIYGAVVDSACIEWNNSCDQRGACWFYDPSIFRLFFHGMTAAIMFLAFIVDSIVWYKANSIQFSDDFSPKKEKTEQTETCCPQFETTV